MTTIAWDGKRMACDALWTENGIKAVKRTKIHRNKYGVLIGYAGSNDSRKLHAILEKVKKPSDLPTHETLIDMNFESHALIVFPDRKCFTIATMPEDYDAESYEIGLTEISWPFWAVGAGSGFALGALRWGHTAYEACKAGCDFDPNSAEPIFQLALEVKAVKPKAKTKLKPKRKR